MRVGSLSNALQFSSSGLAAERFRMDTISSNIANANTVAKPGEDGYHRRSVQLILECKSNQSWKIEKDLA
jgi:flagellar basal-body rod protein FlgC